MYKISVPIMASTITKENLPRYAELCKKAGVARIFLAIGSIEQAFPKDLKETVAFFRVTRVEPTTVSLATLRRRALRSASGPIP